MLLNDIEKTLELLKLFRDGGYKSPAIFAQKLEEYLITEAMIAGYSDNIINKLKKIMEA